MGIRVSLHGSLGDEPLECEDHSQEGHSVAVSNPCRFCISIWLRLPIDNIGCGRCSPSLSQQGGSEPFAKRGILSVSQSQ